MAKKDPCGFYWKKLLGQAKVSLTGASDVALRVQLFEVLQQFFDESNCWQEIIDVTVIPDTLDYPLNPLSGRILRLYGVIDQNNVQQPALMPQIGILRFQYPYTDVQPMHAVVIKTVADPFACYPPGIPEWVMPVHGLGIFHGVLGNMMMQPGQAYSNPKLAEFHLHKFKDATSHARVAMSKMNTVGAQAWSFPQTFKTYSQKGGVSTFNVLPTPR